MNGKRQRRIRPHAVSDALDQRLESHQILYISASIGWGKTTAVKNYFRVIPHTYASLRGKGALEKVERDSTGVTILDDLHVLTDRLDLQQRLLALLRNIPDEAHVVLLSRAPLPEWLLPFQLSGLLALLDSSVLALGTEDVAKLAENMGLELSQEDTLRLWHESTGHPLAAQLICLELTEGRPLNTETVQRAYARMFLHLDRELFDCWDLQTRRLLLSVSFFDSFTVELAQILTGDDRVEQTLTRLLQTSSFIDRARDTYRIHHEPFRAYLQHKAETTWSRQEVEDLYANAGAYYQNCGDLPAALSCYSRNGDHAKVSELLVENSKRHPGHGAYYQLRNYYRNLPESEVLASPELMSGMSILCSLTFDVEGSEKWYGALRTYADSLDRRDRRTALSWLNYLDIALPHRGSVNIKALLLTAYDRLKQGSIDLPEFCVTSNSPSVLRGGKDFSEWVPQDKLLYDTIRAPVAAVLGRLGVGLPEIALAESRYEKGEDITGNFIVLAARRVEIQRKGAPEMEFVLTALLAKCQCDRGNTEQAVRDLTAFRSRMEAGGQKQLLPGIDALLCRIDLLEVGEYAYKWFTEEAPDENDFFIMERYRYLTKVRCYLQRGDELTALVLLGRLLDCFERYGRTLDRIEALALLAVCRYRMGMEDWQEHLTAALELAQKYGYVRVFAHQGAALRPLLRAWRPPKKWAEQKKRAQYLSRVRKAASAFASVYPNYLTPNASKDLQNLKDLTKREMEILRLMGQGKKGEEMEEILGLTRNTMKTHYRKLFKRLGVSSRSEAVAAAQKLHLI